MNFCTNCGQKLVEGAKDCPNCGEKMGLLNKKQETPDSSIQKPVSRQSSIIKPSDLDQINKTISLKNNQKRTVNKSLIVAFFSLVITVLPFYNNNPLTGFWTIAFIGMFVFLSAIIVAFIFKSRAKKLQTLITGENVLASWKFNEDDKLGYVNYLFENEKAKNKGIFWVTSILIVVIFGVFILVINEGKAVMLLVMFALIGFIGLFAFGMPIYYKTKNLNGDGNVLIGKKFAYINGFFHNWDFPLSGIKKCRVINEPFYGLHIQYYYTDRTFTNTEELNIPAPQELDLKHVINELKG
ncbi:MAG: zinc-ribbon domain-containing protein [Lutibacter sp.]|nr:zinc-ribbon domain-containing protein [Lutibacter sp.]MDP3358627.1 zinc-ribbon domain-containing protein [Lutibacter sp.]